ncbi:unnamed protein product [Pleuronectes platessa]|uniref:SFR19-like C-terminal domain-containing protein n=1 Tax=Pleuronectes platessa TaxID=8262 RepID=A0A9N7YKT8_PLEPL|nr:unnamed protein product [Pleuronectes platessa]
MYDPFHPTEGDKEVRMQEGGEGEKYDPFDPTGSPASDTHNGSDKAGGGENVDERGDEKEEEYPDSTLTDLLSPYLVAKLPLGSKVDCSTIKPGEQRQSADSDHSEIEEGEIVGAAERNQSSKRAERAILSLNSPIVSFFGPKPERILRVLDGDGFVSLCAKGSWEVDREPEEEPVVGVEDLRRKLVSRRKERYLSFPTSSTLSPQPPPPSSNPPASTSSSPLTTPTEQDSKKHKSSKSSKDREGQKIKDRKAGEKEERRKKKRKEKVGGGETSKEKEQGHKTGKERTITVTTTTTTTTVPGSPRLSPTSPCWPKQDPDKPHKRKKKRKWHSTGSRSRSFSPPKYRSFESDRYSQKFEIDVLSLDGEALDSDYPSLEDTPPAALVPEPPVLSPKTKITLKTERHHQGKKSRTLKKIGQPKSTFSSRIKNKCLSSLMVTSGSPSVSSRLPSIKQAKKFGKDKDRDKCSRKDSGRSGKSNKESGGSRKGKLQSKVSVLVREGVSSTTGTSVGSGKLGMDLLGPGITGGSSGGSVVGGSIAVVFCRDNESRSPFLKPCSELPSLGGRSKDLSSMGKRNSLAASPASLTSSAGLKSKKTKPSSITSTSSSSASSPSSSLVTKHCRRLAKKTRDKGGAAVVTAACSQANTTAEGWGGTSLDVQSAVGNGNKSVSPHTDQVGPPPCSSSSSTTSVLPPSSSPQQTPPLSIAPLQDTRGSSPDSQTVDSSCKTPDPSFIAENCPTQTSPTLPTSSPTSLSAPQGPGLSITLSTPMAKPPPLDDASNTLVSPSCSSSSAGCGLTSLSLPPSLSDTSSVSSSSANKPPLPPPPAAHALPWSLQTGVDCTTGGVLALTALLFKMEEANIASRAKAQEFIQATNQILSQANQSQSQQHGAPSSATASSQIPPPPSVHPPPELSPTQFILHSSLPLVGCSKTPTSHLHPSIGGGCIQTPPSIMPLGLSGVTGTSGDTGWDNGSKDPDKYLKKLHTQERAVEEVKLAIKPYYQRKDINKDEYKDILRKAVHKICHSRTGEINPVKVSNLVKLYVQRYKYFRKHGRKMDDEERIDREPGALQSSDY